MITQWNAVKSAKFDTLPDFIDQAAATVAKAQQNNFTRWPILGETVWPNPQALGSYQAEVDYLKTWLKLRIAYLDSQFNGKAATQTLLSVSDTSPHFGDIVKLTSTVSDPSATPVTNGSVSFLSGALVLGSATLDGTGSATFTTADLPVGTDAITAVYSGDATNGLSASNATTVHVSPSIAPTIARLSASSGSIQQNAAVTLAASITTSNGNGTPNGTFTFFSGATQVGSASLVGGAATATLTNLPAGTDSVTARYSGDESYQPSTSNAVIINVIPTASTATPIFTPAGGTYTSTQSVTINDSSTGAVIYYTTDSSTPTTSSTVYAGAITVSASMTLKAMAVAPGMNASPIATAAYLIQSSTACSVPAIVGVHVCNPVVGSAYSSPLQITATGKGASGTVSRMEVWLDGVKKYSNAGSSVTVSMTMTSGPHYVNVVEVDSKGAYVKSGRINFTITATCSTPTSPGVHMCTPLTGASYSSPIVVKAAGAGASGVVSRMELWIDGKKISNYPGAFINTSVSLPAGLHQATTVEVDSKGAYLKSAVAKFTVK